MKDFAGSRSTYYSLAREKLSGKHPRIFNLLLILVLISMAGLATFLLSDIISFGLSSDHESVLAGLEHIDPVKSIMSIINWNEKNTKPAASYTPVVQKGGLISLSVANSSPKMSVTGRLDVNISGEENSSIFRMDNLSQKAKVKNPSNSSPTPNSFSSNPVSSGSAVRNTGSGTSSNKLVKEKGTTALIKTQSSSSRKTPISQSLKEKDKQQDLNYANYTIVNSTQINSTQVNSMQANSTQLNNVQADNTSTGQIQIKETSTIKSPINETSMSQPEINPSPPKSSQIILSQIKAAEADSSQVNPFSNKEVSAKNTLEIKFKTDSTTSPKSENSPGGVHKGSGAVSCANAPSSPIASESSSLQYKKNDARDSGDSTSISESISTGKGSGSAQKLKSAVTSKTEKAQEIRYQKIANKNRLAENARKKAATARERAR